MIKILFICHGNICRSPMAEFVLKDMVRRAGIAEHFEIASAATSSEELGNPVYPPVRKLLAEHNISCAGKTARRMRRSDYEEYDLIIGMDRENMRYMSACFGPDSEGKLHKLLEYAGRPQDSVADPWYTGNFAETWDDVNEGCLGLLNLLCPNVTLDFSSCRTRDELFDELRRKMLWRDSYGSNLDALYDILTGMSFYGRQFTVLMPSEDSACRRDAERICRVFADAGKSICIE